MRNISLIVTRVLLNIFLSESLLWPSVKYYLFCIYKAINKNMCPPFWWYRRWALLASVNLLGKNSTPDLSLIKPFKMAFKSLRFALYFISFIINSIQMQLLLTRNIKVFFNCLYEKICIQFVISYLLFSSSFAPCSLCKTDAINYKGRLIVK